jgi:4-amino-4-deoxy-L-arabinose transferase-like glycosyltransferase
VTQTFRTLTARHPRALLVALCLLLWLPGFFTLPAGDRDESRFAQATRQMLESGDAVDIRNGTEARNRKPIGIYWLQLPPVWIADEMGLAHDNPIWPYRLPSLAGVLLAVLAVERFGRRLVGAPAAWLAAALLASAVLPTVEVHIAKTDAALLGATTLAMLLLGEAYVSGRLSAGRAVVFWVALGAGVLLKGPITLMMVGLAAVTLAVADRRAGWLRALRPAWGGPLALAIVLPWFVAIGIATHGGFFRDAVGGDLGNKLAGGDDGHGGPPGYHTLLLSLTLFPAGWAVLRALPAAWAERRAPAVRFLLAWVVPAWLVFEAVPTKLPHYPLPVAPALLLLAAAWLTDPHRRLPPRWLAGLSAGLFALAAAVLGIGAAALPAAVGAAWWLGVPALAAAALLATLVLRALRRGEEQRAALLGVLAAVPLYAAVLGFEAPRLTPLWIAPRVAAVLAAHPEIHTLASTGFAEPSLRLLCGTATEFLPGAAAARFLMAGPGRAVLVEGRARSGFEAEANRLGEEPVVVATLDGFNYSSGRHVTLTLFAGP